MFLTGKLKEKIFLLAFKNFMQNFYILQCWGHLTVKKKKENCNWKEESSQASYSEFKFRNKLSYNLQLDRDTSPPLPTTCLQQHFTCCHYLILSPGSSQCTLITQETRLVSCIYIDIFCKYLWEAVSRTSWIPFPVKAIVYFMCKMSCGIYIYMYLILWINICVCITIWINIHVCMYSVDGESNGKKLWNRSLSWINWHIPTS